MASAGTAGAAEPPSFDLICTGQSILATGAPQPFVTRLSIDLAGRRWCDQQVGCPYVFPIAARRGDDLELLAVKTPLNEAAFDVDLKSGVFKRQTRIPDRPESPVSAIGACARAPFTPFPH